MLHCPTCQAELDPAVLPQGRCPHCHAVVQKPAQRTVSGLKPVDVPSPGTQPPATPLSGDSIDIELIDDSLLIDTEPDPENVLDESLGTIEFSSSAEQPRKPPTVDNVGDRTVDFGALMSERPKKRSTQSLNADFTVDLSQANADLANKLSASWGGTFNDSTPQHQTIKQDEGSRVGHKSTVPVKARKLTARGEGRPVMARPLAPDDAPDYELLNIIGEGGMGVVYAAHQSSIARTVAVKMLKPTSRVSDEHRDKFISEAVVTGELDHPNIVPIYDLGANDEGALFYSMKRVRGTPWDDVLDKKSLDENLNILLRVADAVAFAHANGVVHRDLKPENVMLGDFGEVLVMDWGLARVTEEFPSSGSIYQTNTLGGTPAYMAPEMARGPIEDIDERSDIYLLGAILYEVIGGKAPHSGRDVMACLMAAAQNRIDPIDYDGELLAVAMKAMAHEREDRFASVKEFQQAVRTYQSHSESLLLTGHAERHLAVAIESQNYQKYARALYGFEESLALWDGNRRAQEKLLSTRLAYAKAALANDDLELAESLLDASQPEQQELAEQVRRAQRERTARQLRLKNARRLVAALGLALVGLGVWSYIAIRGQYNEAVTQRDRADQNANIAKQNEQQAVAAKEEEAKQRAEADKRRAEAEAAQLAEAQQRKLADERRVEAEAAKEAEAEQRALADKAAAEARAAEAVAVTAKENEEYEAYVAKIGLAAAKVDENAYGFAQLLLDECPPERRNWEWGRLSYLCQLAEQVIPAEGQVDAVAYSPDGSLIASGDWSGQLVVRDARTAQVRFAVKHGPYVHAVAFSPDGRLIATGSSDGRVRIVDAASGTDVRTIDAHGEGVLSVAFSPAGKQLVTTGYDNTAKLWNVADGAALQTLLGHNWWVWSAAFAPDGNRLVTVSQEGRAIVWQRPSPQAAFAQAGEFNGHDGPVYAVAIAPTGDVVATGGYDGSVRLWRPDDLAATDLTQLVEGTADNAHQRTLAAHEAAVRSLAFDAAGKRLLSGGHDNVVWLWDVASGKTIKALRGHASRVEAVAFAPAGDHALSGGQDRELRIWNLQDYEESRIVRGRILEGHADAILAAKFTPDARGVVTASRDRTAHLYDAATGKLVRTFAEGHEFLATTAIFFDDGRRLATGAGDNTVRLWDVLTGAELVTLRSTGRSGTLAVAPSGQWLATGGPSNVVQLWDTTTGKSIAQLAGHEAEVTAAAIDRTGRVLATGDDRGVIRLWDIDPQGRTATPRASLTGHSRTVTALEFTPSGDILVSSSGDYTCGQWYVATGQELRDRVLKHDEWVASVDIASDGKRAVTTCDDGSVRVWSLDSAQVVATTKLDAGVVNAARFAPDGQRVLVTSWAARKVWQWEPEQRAATLDKLPAIIDFAELGGQLWAAEYTPDGQRVLTIGGNDARLWSLAGAAATTQLRFSPHGAVASVDVSPDGKWLATGSWDTTAKIWDMQDGRVVRKLDGLHTGYINSVAFAADSRTLATAGDDGRLGLWDLSTGKPKAIKFAGHDAPIRSVRFSPAGMQLVTASSDRTARIWDATSGELLHTLVGHEWGVLAADFSRDGTRIVTGSDDNTARVWDATTGEFLNITLAGHTSSITSVAFSDDGSRILTASQDNTARLWDARTGKEVLTLAGHTRELTSVGFAPDGRTALTASRDGTAILWPTLPWQAADVAQR